MAATTLAVAGVATAAASSGASFIQAAKQQRLQRQAEMEAEKAMAEARKKLEVNFYDQLAINKEPYELQREALLSQGAQAINTAAESERGVAATAGRVMMAQNDAQGGVRTAMGKEMQDLNRLSAMEDSRLRDVNVQLDLGQIQGAQLAARDAQRAAAQATTQGINMAANAAGKALSLVPLYMNNSTTKPSGLVSQAAYDPYNDPKNPYGAQANPNVNPVPFTNSFNPINPYGTPNPYGSISSVKYDPYLDTQNPNGPNYDPYFDRNNPNGAYNDNSINPSTFQTTFNTPNPYNFGKPY